MNRNEKFVITIHRELGSGGTTVGRLLAERLGVAFYDKVLVKALEERFHRTADEIESMKGEKRDWWSDVKRFMNVGPGRGTEYYLPGPGAAVFSLSQRGTVSLTPQAETLFTPSPTGHCRYQQPGSAEWAAQILEKIRQANRGQGLQIPSSGQR